MGWKAIKEHYEIKHNVHVRGGLITIGSAYVPDIIAFDFEGKFRKSDDLFVRGELDRVYKALAADPALLLKLIRQEDVFERSIRVYSFKGAEITEHFCEELGWPNVTHDGKMMYKNQFTTDRNEAIEWALKEAESAVKWENRRLGELQKEIEETKARRDEYSSDVEILNALSRERADNTRITDDDKIKPEQIHKDWKESKSLEAQLADAKKALKPFADACTISTHPDEKDIDDSIAATKITFGDLRKARSFLEGSNKTNV